MSSAFSPNFITLLSGAVGRRTETWDAGRRRGLLDGHHHAAIFVSFGRN